MVYKSRALREITVFYAVYLSVIALIAHFFVGYIPAIHQDQRTLFLDQANPSPTLYTSRWNNKDFWFSWTLVFLWAVTYSGILMMVWWDVTWLQVLHIVITALVLILFVAMVVFQTIDRVHANDPPSPTMSWIKNPAHDRRYCCIYGAVDTTCPNNPSGSICPVVPAVGDLAIDGDFDVGYWFRAVYTAFLVAAIIQAFIYVRRAWETLDENLGDAKVQVIVASEREPTLEPVGQVLRPPQKPIKNA